MNIPNIPPPDGCELFDDGPAPVSAVGSPVFDLEPLPLDNNENIKIMIN